jgi:hypothetical protein
MGKDWTLSSGVLYGVLPVEKKIPGPTGKNPLDILSLCQVNGNRNVLADCTIIDQVRAQKKSGELCNSYLKDCIFHQTLVTGSSGLKGILHPLCFHRSALDEPIDNPAEEQSPGRSRNCSMGIFLEKRNSPFWGKATGAVPQK